MSAGVREGLEWTVFDTPVTLAEVTAPTIVEDNTLKLYAKDKAGVSNLYFKDDAEVEHDLDTTGMVTGSGAAGQVAFWTGAAVLSGENDLFWDSTLNRLGIGTTTPSLQLHVKKMGASASVRFETDTVGSYATLSLLSGAKEWQLSHSSNDAFIAFYEDGATARLKIATGGVVAIPNLTASQFVTTDASSNLVSNDHLGAADPHTGYRLESADHSHQSTGLQAGTLDHGLALTGLSDDDHSLYLLASDATSRAAFATNWLDLTDGGATTLHSHAGGGDHGALTGLLDDDHTQYVLRTGRSGSANNIIINITSGYPDGKISGTNIASNYLILESTTHATKGKILFGNSAYDEVNNRLGLGDNGPTARLELFGTGVAHTAFKIGNSDANDEGIINRIFARVSSGSAEYIGTQFNMRDGGSTGTTTNLNQINVLSGTATSGSQYANKMQLQNIKTGGSVTNLIGLSVDMPHNSASGHNVSQVNFFVVDSSNLYAGTNTFSTVIGYRCTSLYNAATGTGFAFFSEGGINEFDSGNVANVVLKIKAIASQTADLQQWLNSAGGVLTSVESGGRINLAGLTTNTHFKVATDNTDPTGGGGAATGRIPIHDAAGNLRYIPYY